MKYVYGSVIALFFILFWFIGVVSIDPDFGWHLKMGEYILQHGIPKTDPFSYTMPSYPFVDYEWLANIFIYQLYKFGRMGLLSLLFTGVLLSAFIIQIPKKYYSFAVLPLLLIFVTILSFVGIRIQIIVWFIFSLFFILLKNYDRLTWQRYLIPFILLFWTNIHGSFFIGLILLVLFFVSCFLQKRKITIQDWLIVLFSVISSVISPYGFRLWEEILSISNDQYLHTAISEWLPTIFIPLIPLWFYTAFSLVLVWKQRNHFSLFEKITYVFFLLMGLWSIRHMILWFIVSLGMTVAAIQFFYSDVKKISEGKERFWFMYKIFFSIVIVVCIAQTGMNLKDTFISQEEHWYPKQSVLFIKGQHLEGNIFSLYEWGGYLIWNLPEKKVFIDGRMPTWRLPNKKQNQSSYAFKEYMDVMAGKIPFKTIQEKYNISYLLIRTTDVKMVQRIQHSLTIVHQDPTATLYSFK
ncbi:hypothetical protein HGA88_05190 [Candidatus Roizmanbacteria bacterium]|nr:hypothetical protein [Candidatus Roizmanbacteria bacterium]